MMMVDSVITNGQGTGTETVILGHEHDLHSAYSLVIYPAVTRIPRPNRNPKSPVDFEYKSA